MTHKLIVVERTANSATNKILLDVYAYWQSLRSGDSIPYRRDFRPAAIRRLLPYIILVDVLNDPRDFQFRLVGTAFITVTGQELTGRLISEVFPPQFRMEVFEGWNAIVENGGPNWACGNVWIENKDFISWQGVALPLRAETGSVDQLVGAGVFNMPHL